MENYMDKLKDFPIFRGIGTKELKGLLECLKAKTAQYGKGETIFLEGNKALRVGIVCKGRVQIIRDDIFGNRSIIEELGAGNLFGEAFACAKTEFLPVGVIGATDCAVLMINFRKIITTCTSACGFHSILIENMLQIVAEKNLRLNRKIEILSARTIREKLSIYLNFQAAIAGSEAFEIPFNRQALADYLSVDRSAMSAELSRMKKEGLISFHKSSFKLLKSSCD